MDYIVKIIASSAVIIISFHLFKYLLNKLRECKIVKKFPGPTAYPLIGNLHLFLGDTKDISNKLVENSVKYPSLCRLWIGPKLVIVLSDPEYIRIILKSSYSLEKNYFYVFTRPLVGNGLLTSSASIWNIHRKILNPEFKEQSLKIYVDSILKNAKRFSKNLETLYGKEIDVLHYVNLCTLDIAFDALFGNDLNLQNSSECKLLESIAEWLKITIYRCFKVWLYPDIIFYNSSLGKKLEKDRSYIIEFISEIIKKRKESIQEDKIIGDSIEADAGKNASNLLDILLKSCYETGEISEQDIRDEVITLILAASETTGGVLYFVFLMLATFPEIQKRVYDELYQIYGSSDPEDFPITYQDIKNMNFLERVIKETLRLFPSAPFIGRTLTEDVEVDKNVLIPKNCCLFLPIFTLQRNEKYWKDPLTFNPDRFLPGNYDPKCFLPFSLGKRDCIGQRFAMIEMKGIIATILRKFIVQIDNPVAIEDIGLETNITLKATKPQLLRFEKR